MPRKDLTDKDRAIVHLEAAKKLLTPIAGYTELSEGIKHHMAVAWIDATLAMVVS